LIIKSLLTSLYQREEIYPSLAKRGEGRFFKNDTLLMHSLVNQNYYPYLSSRIYRILSCRLKSNPFIPLTLRGKDAVKDSRQAGMTTVTIRIKN